MSSHSQPEQRASPRTGLAHRKHLPFAFGMTSLVLGTIAILLVLFPVLGIPLSSLGLFFGIVGVIVGLRFGGVLLRWSVMGVAVSALALAINVALAFAPAGYLPGREVPQHWNPPPDRPYVSPPE